MHYLKEHMSNVSVITGPADDLTSSARPRTELVNLYSDYFNLHRLPKGKFIPSWKEYPHCWLITMNSTAASNLPWHTVIWKWPVTLLYQYRINTRTRGIHMVISPIISWQISMAYTMFCGIWFRCGLYFIHNLFSVFTHVLWGYITDNGTILGLICPLLIT